MTAAQKRNSGVLRSLRSGWVPSGKVVVKVDDRRAVVRLTDGRGVATFGARRPLSRGRYWVKARYLGDQAHGKDRAVTRVRVTRGR